MLHMSDPEHRNIPKQSPPSTLRPGLSSLHRPSFIFDPDDVFQKYLISGEASSSSRVSKTLATLLTQQSLHHLRLQLTRPATWATKIRHYLSDQPGFNTSTRSKVAETLTPIISILGYDRPHPSPPSLEPRYLLEIRLIPPRPRRSSQDRSAALRLPSGSVSGRFDNLLSPHPKTEHEASLILLPHTWAFALTQHPRIANPGRHESQVQGPGGFWCSIPRR